MFKVLNTVGYYLCCNCLRSVTVDSKKIDICCKNIISDLPEALICHILSFLPIEDSALTSVLSKKWQYLFAFRPNLEFDDAVIYLNPNGKREETMFMDFVDRVLSLQGDSPINKFSLTCRHFVDSICVSRWISNVVERGVSDLDLRCTVNWDNTMPPGIFVSKALVHLRIETGNGVVIDVEDVFLPKLKTLYLNKVLLQHSDNGFVKLITSCHVLEDLVVMNLCWDGYLERSVSSKTLKTLKFFCLDDHDVNPESVSFDTPNLVYLLYHDCVADKYKEMNFDSLVVANICLEMTSNQREHASYEHMVGNATDFFMGISNVKILYLFAHTIEGLHHKDTIKCEDVDGCLCKSSRDIPSCLSSSPVQFLTIWKFGEICDDYDDMEKQIELVMYFLETMPNLEEMRLFHDTQIDEDVISKLQMLVTSSKCAVYLIPEV